LSYSGADLRFLDQSRQSVLYVFSSRKSRSTGRIAGMPSAPIESARRHATALHTITVA